MKKISLISIALIVCSLLLFSFISSNSNKIETARTEEYAIVDVLEIGKKKIIRVTIGEEPAQEVTWEKEKTDVNGDLKPVMKELHTLNEKGFEMVNISLAYTTPGSGGTMPTTPGYPRQTFLMKRKL